MGIVINSVYLHRCSPDWYWDTEKRKWKDLILWYIHSGKGELKAGERRYELIPGRIFLLDGGERYISGHDKNNPLVVESIHFTFTGQSRRRPFFTTVFFDHSFASAICKRIHHYWDKGERERAALWTETLINEVSFVEEQRVPIDYNRGRICSLTAMIEENPSKKWTLREMCEIVNISPNHLTRIFGRYINCTPKTFVIECRINLAKMLLLSSSNSVSLISEKCGYTDIYFFSRQFKQHVGLSPARFRKES